MTSKTAADLLLQLLQLPPDALPVTMLASTHSFFMQSFQTSFKIVLISFFVLEEDSEEQEELN